MFCLYHIKRRHASVFVAFGNRFWCDSTSALNFEKDSFLCLLSRFFLATSWTWNYLECLGNLWNIPEMYWCWQFIQQFLFVCGVRWIGVRLSLSCFCFVWILDNFFGWFKWLWQCRAHLVLISFLWFKNAYLWQMVRLVEVGFVWSLKWLYLIAWFWGWMYGCHLERLHERLSREKCFWLVMYCMFMTLQKL